MSRLNQILAALLAVQIVLGVVVFWPRPAASGAGEPLLPNFKAADVTGLTLSDGQGKRLALAKNGEAWVMPEAGNYPVDGAKVTPFLEKLEKIKTNRLVTQTEGSHAQLKVAANDFNTLVEVKAKDGTAHKLYLGSAAGGSATHVRADDRPEVYLSGEINSFEASTGASSWIDTLYFTVPLTAPVNLTLENANGTFNLIKTGETWTMEGLAEGETFNEGGFSGLLNQITNIRMTEPLGKEDSWFGKDKPLATITLKATDKTYTLKLGAKDTTDNSYVLKSSESPYYVRVAEYTGSSLVDKKRDDFLQQAPSPTSEPGIEAPSAP